jgi:hypothetical protein
MGSFICALDGYDIQNIIPFAIQTDGSLKKVDSSVPISSWSAIRGINDKIFATEFDPGEMPPSTLTIYQIGPDGSLAVKVKDRLFPDGIFAKIAVGSPSSNPDIAFMFAPDKDGTIVAYRYTAPDTVEEASRASIPGFSGPTIFGMQVDMAIRVLYALVDDDGAYYLVSFSISGFGALAYLDKVKVPNDVDDIYPYLTLDPKSRFVYLAARYKQFIFCKVSKGYFSAPQLLDGIVSMRVAAMLPTEDGKYLLVSDYDELNAEPNQCICFSIDEVTGKLTKTSALENAGSHTLTQSKSTGYIYGTQGPNIYCYQLDSNGILKAGPETEISLVLYLSAVDAV